MADKKDVTKLTPKQEAEINKLLKERLGYEIDISNVRAEYSSLGNDILSELRTRARIEKDMKKDAKAYIGYMQDIKETNKEIAKIEGTILALEEELKNASEERAEVLNKTIKYLKKETSELRDQNRIIAEQLKSARGFRTTIAGISADIDKVNKGFKSVKTRLDKIYDFFDVGAMFKMLKSIKTTSAEMGLIGARSLAVSKNIQRASMNTVSFGVNLEDVAKIQGSYSDELGTTDFLSEKTLANFAALGKVTGMGAEAVGKMAAEMKQVGMSSEKTAQFMSQSFNDAASMGLNATKVMKNFSQNLKMLNKYNFKGGAKSLMRMAESATKMGISMNFAAPMAEKLFDIEGAVEMSAQLQVMGGEWAKLGDPFKLMYMARNDMEGLTKSIINATKGAAFFNKETGEFEIPAL
jgi:predicted  nucleic acid-binding Zn-ribbon protein